MKINLILILILTLLTPVQTEETMDLCPNAKAAYLMDYETGTVLFKKNETEKHYPASMTKMMSLLLVIEQIKSGNLSYEDEVVASQHATSMGGSQIYLEEGERMSVMDLLKSSALASANDAITALAEKVGGTEENFVAMMNDKAEELGCTQTHFVNPTGLHDLNHYSCAKDMALIAQALIHEGQEDILQFTSRYEDYIRQGDNQFWLVNTNKLIRTYSGMDGLKTGYTSNSLYCITVTAQKEDLRLIGVVMNEPTKEARNKEAIALLDYGFASVKMVNDVPLHEEVTQIKVEKGKPERVSLLTMEPVRHLSPIREEVTVTEKTFTLNRTRAPLKQGEEVGKFTLHYSNGQSCTVGLTVSENVIEFDFMDILFLTFQRAFIF